MSALIVATDLDGVVVDSHRALRAAYASAGVRWRPNRPWREWCDPVQHDLKTMLYPEALSRLGRVTALGRLAISADWLVLTGASRESVAVVESTFGVRFGEVVTGLGVDQKIEQLLAREVELYFDDDPIVVLRAREAAPRCQTVLVTPP